MIIEIPDDLDVAFIDFVSGGLYFMTGLGTMSEEELSKDQLRLARILVDILKEGINEIR